MESDIQDYIKGSEYEIFIHRAFRDYDTSKPGRHGSVIQNLIRIERGDKSFEKWHGSFAKQFGATQHYMCQAMDKYLQMKRIPRENIRRLEELRSEIDKATSSDNLMTIVKETIELTQAVIND